MSEKAAVSSRTPARRRISRTVDNVKRLFVKADTMPSLAMVLSGDTCYPISLQNFEAYLIHKEYSVELLQFIVWFQDYRQRFLQLPAATQAISPGRSHFAFAIPSPARTAERARASKARADAVRYADGTPLACGQSSLMSTTSKSGVRIQLTPVDTSRTHYVRPCEQPFREECMRIVATFFKPGAAKELPLDPVVRDTVIRDLTWNTHPDVFLPVYEEIYHTLETISLPRFLAAASANINRPKQLLWYSMGAVETAIGVLLAILLIAIVPIPPAANRAWRLFSVLPASVGLSTIYSAYRGFCSQVWGRTTTQLHEWELEEMDEETGAHWDSLLAPRLPSPAPSPPSTIGSSRKSYLQDRKAPESWCEENASNDERGDTVDPVVSSAIAPFNDEDSCHRVADAKAGPAPDITCHNDCKPYPTPFLSLLARFLPARSRSPSPSKSTPATPRPPHTDIDVEKARVTAYGGKRSPFFGPEKIVLDPRIRALHNAVMRDLVCFFVVVTLAFSALVMSVPDGQN